MEEIVTFFMSKKYFADKVQKLLAERKDMNEASLDASRCNQDIMEYLGSLPQVEAIEILGALIKNEKEIQQKEGFNLQDLENQDASNFNQPSRTADAGNDCPQDLATSVTVRHSSDNLRNDHVSIENVKARTFGYHGQPTSDTAGHHKHPNDLEDNLSAQVAASKRQVKQQCNKQAWEFPSSQESQSLSLPKDSRDPQLPSSGSVQNPENNDNELDASSTNSSSGDTGSLNEELSSSVSTVGSRSNQPRTSSPIQADADNNRSTNLPHPTEHGHSSQPWSRDWNSGPQTTACTACRRFANQEAVQHQLSEQRRSLDICSMQLTEALRNCSQVALQQATREMQNTQVTVPCANCDAMQEEKEELEEQLRNHAYQVQNLRQRCVQLLAQIAEHERTVQAQHQEMKEYKSTFRFLRERNKNCQVEREMANKRTFEFAEKQGKEQDAFLKDSKAKTKNFEKIQRKLLALKEENEMLKERLKGKEKWKETERNSMAQGNMHQLRAQLMALQYRVRLRFSAGQAKDDDNRPQRAHDDIEPDVD